MATVGMAQRKITVLVADDQTMFRMLMVVHLRRVADFRVVGDACSGAECLKEMSRLRPDVVLLDIQLGDMDGLEVTASIKRMQPTTKVILMTGFHSDEYIYRAFKLGASGYISKDTSLDRVIEAIRSAHAGEELFDPVKTIRLIREMGSCRVSTASNASAGSPDGLTPREIEVLGLIADGLSNEEMAGRLFVSKNTIKQHVKHLFRKLGLHDRVQAVLAALELGVR